jgi:hypothetical protein
MCLPKDTFMMIVFPSFHSLYHHHVQRERVKSNINQLKNNFFNLVFAEIGIVCSFFAEFFKDFIYRREVHFDIGILLNRK